MGIRKAKHAATPTSTVPRHGHIMNIAQVTYSKWLYSIGEKASTWIQQFQAVADKLPMELYKSFTPFCLVDTSLFSKYQLLKGVNVLHCWSRDGQVSTYQYLLSHSLIPLYRGDKAL